MNTTVTITKKVQAAQFVEGVSRPDGTFDCIPEVHWAAGRQLIYFTYAEFMPTHWMGVAKDPIPPSGTKLEVLESRIDFRDGYSRKALPFMFWSVKSEGSVTGNHRPVYLDFADADMVALWHDYCELEQWPNPTPPRIEYREIGGGYGRGFRSVYMKPGDWLLRETVPDGHNNYGTKNVVSVVPDEEFRRMVDIHK